LTTKLHKAAQARHIWWGVSVEDKKYGLPRIRQLQSAPATVRFLSIEPLLEDLGTFNIAGIHWVIVGGESGPGARPMDPAWVRRIKTQCDTHRTLFFFKQWGGIQKKKTGRELNGRTYDAMPTTSKHHPASRAARARLIDQLMQHADQWSSRPLVQLPPATSPRRTGLKTDNPIDPLSSGSRLTTILRRL